MKQLQNINRVTIIGMGALGILYGDFFAKKLGPQSVSFLADEQRVKRYQAEGVTCNGKVCNFRFQTPDESKEPVELLIFAVKAAALGSAIQLAKPYVNADTIILSVLNGISSEEIIARELGENQVIYSIAQGMDAVKLKNALTYSHLGTLCIGILPEETAKQEKLAQVSELFDRTGFPYVVEADIQHRLWSKWMLNVGVNQAVMVAAGTYGTIQQPGEAREMMIAAMWEALQVAEKEGVAVTEKDLNDYVALVDTLSPEGMPSMRQDGLARRYSEVELFAGTVLKKAAEYGLDVPVNQMLYRTIQELEQTY